MRYEDFLIRIASSSGGRFEVQVQSPAGEGRAPFHPPFPIDLAGARAAAARRTTQRELYLTADDQEHERTPDRIGEVLFNVLFQGEVRDLYERSLGILARDADLGLRIKISLDPREPALAKLQELPWELLRRPETRQYLGLSHRQPIVRHLSVPQTLKAVSRPELLRVLLVAASPSGLTPLNLERERKNLREALKKVEGVEVTEVESPTLAGLREAFRRQEIHVLHFMGHGGFAGGAGVLYFETHDGTADPVCGEDLIQKLVDFPTLRLVVLNTCESARAGDQGEDGGDPFAGVAQALILAGVPAVVAMRLPVSDNASIAFSQTFYNRLATKDPVDVAVAEGRQEMHSVNREGFEWSIPVVFLQRPDGELFPVRDVPEAPPLRRRASSQHWPLSQAQSRSLATWIFGSLFVAFLLAVFAFAPSTLPVFKQRILAVVSALLAGLFAYFLTGESGVAIRGGKGALGRLAVKSSGGAAAFVLVLVWWLSPWSPVESADLVRLRVLLLSPEGSPVEDARVWTSVGGEPKQVAGGWEFDIPISKLPADGRVTVHASKESAFLSGSGEVRLGADLAPSVMVRLAANPSITVRGIVLDEAGNALEGVRVSIVGHEGEAISTGSAGQFVLPVHAADGQQVQLHAEKAGYEPVTQFHPAGTFPANLILDKP